MAAPLTTDFQAPFDPTGFTSISGAQLLQMTSGAFPQVDKGIIISTTDDDAGNPNVPNAAGLPKWQLYFWRRQSATSVGVYVWNANGASNATFLQWVSINIAGIGAGSIINSMIADNTIQSIKIVSLDYSKITGAPTGLPPSGNAGGSLTGTYPNPSIAAAAVTSAMIAAATILASNIANGTLTLALDAPISGSAKDMARVNAGATGMEAFTPPVIFTSGVVVPTSNALKIPQVNVGATDFQMVAPTTLGRILQQITKVSIVPVSTTKHCALTATPAQTTGPTADIIAGLTAAAFTPLNAASTIIIEVYALVSNSNNGNTTISIFQDAIDAAVAVGTTRLDAANVTGNCHTRFSLGSWGTGSSKVFAAGISCVANSGYLNSTDGSTTLFGGLGSNSWIRITEYL